MCVGANDEITLDELLRLPVTTVYIYFFVVCPEKSAFSLDTGKKKEQFLVHMFALGWN